MTEIHLYKLDQSESWRITQTRNGVIIFNYRFNSQEFAQSFLHGYFELLIITDIDKQIDEYKKEIMKIKTIDDAIEALKIIKNDDAGFYRLSIIQVFILNLLKPEELIGHPDFPGMTTKRKYVKEDEPQPKTKRVRIVKCKNAGFWYRDIIGEECEVYVEDSKYIINSGELEHYFLAIEDCEDVTDEKPEDANQVPNLTVDENTAEHTRILCRNSVRDKWEEGLFSRMSSIDSKKEFPFIVSMGAFSGVHKRQCKLAEPLSDEKAEIVILESELKLRRDEIEALQETNDELPGIHFLEDKIEKQKEEIAKLQANEKELRALSIRDGNIILNLQEDYNIAKADSKNFYDIIQRKDKQLVELQRINGLLLQQVQDSKLEVPSEDEIRRFLNWSGQHILKGARLSWLALRENLKFYKELTTYIKDNPVEEKEIKKSQTDEEIDDYLQDTTLEDMVAEAREESKTDWPKVAGKTHVYLIGKHNKGVIFEFIFYDDTSDTLLLTWPPYKETDYYDADNCSLTPPELEPETPNQNPWKNDPKGYFTIQEKPESEVPNQETDYCPISFGANRNLCDTCIYKQEAEKSIAPLACWNAFNASKRADKPEQGDENV